jgi:hypothetical protein
MTVQSKCVLVAALVIVVEITAGIENVLQLMKLLYSLEWMSDI